MKKWMTSLAVLLCILLVVTTGCGRTAGQPVRDLAVAGSTFAEPLYAKQFDVWYQKTQTKTVYGAISSAGALRALEDRTIDVGASDLLLTPEEEAHLPGSLLEIPTCLGAVAVCVNLPGNPAIRMDAALLSAIFRGQVKSWNDARIAALNPLLKLPSKPVIVIHRADSSGTTGIFTTYLAAADAQWKSSVGSGLFVDWPAGVGAKGNAGMTAMIRQTSGAIGYVEYSYAVQSRLTCVALRNRSGAFVQPGVAAMQAAVPADLAEDLQGTLLDRPGVATYPIVSFTWLMLYREQSYDNRPRERAQAISQLIGWMLGDGQSVVETLNYGALPSSVRTAAQNILKQLTWQGKPLT